MLTTPCLTFGCLAGATGWTNASDDPAVDPLLLDDEDDCIEGVEELSIDNFKIETIDLGSCVAVPEPNFQQGDTFF